MKQEQARTAKVLIALMASMTVGGGVLMTLDNHVPAQGAYSLSSYLKLDPIEEVILYSLKGPKVAWTGIEVFYSNTAQGNVSQFATEGKNSYHFLVCNGKGQTDGQVEAAANWKNQKSVPVYDGVIRICVISNHNTPATSNQQKRTSDLVDSLSRNFVISPEKIRFPANWQL